MTTQEKKIKVLIIDDSAVVRQVLKTLLTGHDDIEIIAAVADPIFAMNRMRQIWPDVILLDLEMPRMDGMTFLRKIMQERPTPIIICSSHTEKGAKVTLEALQSGAVSTISKPKVGGREQIQHAISDVLYAVRSAKEVNAAKATKFSKTSLINLQKKPAQSMKARPKVIAIGASTGGTQALEFILSNLPATVPGIVIVQHMPAHFTSLFAKRLDQLCVIKVKEAQDGDIVMQGEALIAPGGKHTQIKTRGTTIYLSVKDGAPVNRHKPSVDVLFGSIASSRLGNVEAYLLTGMGDDGARGLLSLKNAGAQTVAQDEESSVVFGMPKAAIAIGAVNQVLSLSQIAQQISN